MLRLTDSQEADVRFVSESRRGNPAPVEGAKLTSSDDTVATVVDNGDGSFTVRPTGKVGTVQLNVEADARVGEGESKITGSETLEVVAGEAAKITVQFGEPREQQV